MDVRACGVTRTIENAGVVEAVGDGPIVAVDTVDEPAALLDARDSLAMSGRLAPLLGSHCGTKDEPARAARLLADGRVDGGVTGTVSPADASAVHDPVRRGESHGVEVPEP